MKEQTLIKYCTGCGACVSEHKASFVVDEKGFKIPHPIDRDFHNFCDKVCFSSGRQYAGKKKIPFWGEILSSSYAWAANSDIRYSGSSGGCLTALCIYLLKSGQIDGVVHTGEALNDPTSTQTFISTTAEEILSHTGSRYSSSSPLCHISDYLKDDCKYCFIGKPCDVATLYNLMKLDKRYQDKIKYVFSFFCAGAPSAKANEALLQKMGTSKDECVSLRYRGDGWPGFATAKDAYGRSYKLDYRSVWRDTLGRDIRPICRFCVDGIGEMADLVCFDAWYLGTDKKPVFSESEGRNGVFCRTKEGQRVFSEAIENGYIVSSEYENYEEELRHIQKYQFVRRSTMPSTILAMKVMLRTAPSYPLTFMLSLAKHCKLRSHLSRFFGTIKRVLKSRI